MVIATPTYHIIGKVPSDLLQLGTIIDDLSDVFPLNQNEEIVLRDSRLYCDHETNFESTRVWNLKGSVGVGLKVLAIQGGEASLGGERGVDDTYTFEAIDTLFFYPTPEDFVAAVKSKGLKEYLENSKYAPVYMITGIKTGRNSTISLSRENKIEGRIEAGIDTGVGISISSKFDPSKTNTLTQRAERAEKSVLAIRVRKLAYKKKWLVGGSRRWTNEAHNAGAELVDNELRGEEFLDDKFEVEEVELGDELNNCDLHTEQTAGDTVTTWAIPRT